ncbi:Uncharacterised protein [Serratia grimesii]|uniref:hypothetical protein n=1 Tax=Serratia grimesii TaxID=82995 RepID=UPI00076F3C9D|nr:hypothetical protein [Serratia grimesii]CUW22512.1 Uncharacterised protein [Serratia grimesii]SMZ57660.1 Uncharacterised protein [Serratia grimesii]
MSGFQYWNEHGALMIDSNNKGTYYQDSMIYGGISDVGFYQISTTIGNSSDMGYVSNRFPINESLRWFKPNSGAKMIFGDTDLMTVNAGRMARTRSDMPVESGYRDVFNAEGELVWSVVHSAKIPRIIGFFDIPKNFDLDNNAYTQGIGVNTWLLASNAPGNISYDGEVTGYSGLFFQFIGGALSCQWISKHQNSWKETMRPYGLRIPYAILPNLE